jgi:hypothetical protein
LSRTPIGHRSSTQSCNTVENGLVDEFTDQFGSERFHCEHSVHYHIQSTLMLLIWLTKLRSAGSCSMTKLMDIADGACSNIRALLMPDNTLPAFSDSCYSLFSPDMSQDLELLGTLARRVLGLSHADVGARCDGFFG